MRYRLCRKPPGRGAARPTPDRPQSVEQMMLDRRDFVRELLKDRGDLLVVSGLGAPTYDVAAVSRTI